MTSERTPTDAPIDAIVIGAGFAGLYMLYRLREAGFSARVLEAGGDVGGTWYWNRYPGARCDVESFLYSYSFSPELEQEWEWSERFAGQPEILRYLRHVADRFDLRRDIAFDTRVTSARFDAATSSWQVATQEGATLTARFLITAVGCLSVGNIPDLPGLDRFEGLVFHTGQWPHQPVSFAGRRVGVIGTGSSGIQAIPEIARQAERLTVFQRTPNFSLPARNRPLRPDEVERAKQSYADLRHLSRRGEITGVGDTLLSAEERLPVADSVFGVSLETREAVLRSRWDHGGIYVIQAFGDILLDRAANKVVADFVRRQIEAAVPDPRLAEKLCPQDYPIGSKRVCSDTDYYQTYNRDNVDLVDLREDPIVGFTADGAELSSGTQVPLDALVMATGFDAVTGPILKLNVIGRDGVKLADHWEHGPSTYLGLGIAGFPNLFTITGPLSPSILTNVVVSIEQHVDWIAQCVEFMRDKQLACVEALEQAEHDWSVEIEAIAQATLLAAGDSWYVGANIPGKPRRFLAYAGGVGPYRDLCDEVAAADYRGFKFGMPSPERQAA